MAITLFISICLIAIIILVVSPLRLHPLEVLFTWMVTGYVRANGYFMVSLNEQMLVVPKQFDMYWVFIFGSYTIVPALIVACQNGLVTVHSLLTRIGVILLCVMCLIAFEFWEVALHLLKRHNWHLYNSLLFWLSIVLIVSATHAVFHRIMEREAELR